MQEVQSFIKASFRLQGVKKSCILINEGEYRLGEFQVKASCCGVEIPVHVREPWQKNEVRVIFKTKDGKLESSPFEPSPNNPQILCIKVEDSTWSLHADDCPFKSYLKAKVTCSECGAYCGTESALRSHMATSETNHLRLKVKKLEKRVKALEKAK